MDLIYRLTQEISDEERRTGEKQCFIGHEFRQKDLRVKLERALSSLGLQAYFADEEVTGDFILTKVCKKILVTRASIVDLTTANPNVYYELGIAIGLNKPVFVVLKRGASVPSLLESFVKLHFTSYAGLERELVKQVPDWLKNSIEHHLLYNTHCHFVNALCPDRQRVNPQRGYLIIDQVESTDEAGQPILTHDPDLYAELPDALNRFHFTPRFLDEVPAQDRKYRLCDHCLTLRDSSFTLCHLTRCTSSNAYLLLGLATGLDTPSLMMVHQERDKDNKPLLEIPTMLLGLDAFYYEHTVDISEFLADRVEVFLNRLKSRPLSGKQLPFPDLARRLDVELVPEIPALIEVREILGQPVEVVTDLLGGPKSTDRNDYRLLNEYQVGEETVQVEFHNEIAAFVSCGLGSLGLTEDEQALRQLGLSPLALPPTIINRQLHLKRWEPFEPFGRLTLYYSDDRTVESVSVVTQDAVLSMQGETRTAQTSDARRVLAAIRESLLSTIDDSAPTGLPASLYTRCRDTLLKCSEFDSSVSLQAVFVMGELRPFRDARPTATNRTTRVDQIIDYLIAKHLSDGRSALSVLLTTLHDRYSPDDALRHELEELHIEIERVLDKQPPSERLIAIIPETVRLGDTAALDEALAITQLLTRPPQRAEVLVALVNAMAQMNYLEGVRRVVEIALTIEGASTRDRVLETTARAYAALGDDEKAREVNTMRGESSAGPKGGLAEGIVRIVTSDGSTAGTGFVVSDMGLVATLAYVVHDAGAGPGDTVRVVFHVTGEEREAQVERDWWRGPDAEGIAILRLGGPLPEGVKSLPLGSSAGVEGRTFTTFGFPEVKPVEGIAGKCEIVGRTVERGFPVLQLRSSEVNLGFSGAPVYDTVTRRVVGMVTAISVPDPYGRLAETAFIIPAETLREVCLVLPFTVQDRGGPLPQPKPSTTRVSRALPFHRLSWDDFERLCLMLLPREGFEDSQHYGAAGGERGCDIVATRDGELWYVTCKQVKRCGPKVLLDEIEKIRELVEDEPDLRPAGVLFVASCDVSAQARDRATNRCKELKLACEVWGCTDLDARVQQHSDIVRTFFGRALARPIGIPFQAPPLPAHFVPRPEVSDEFKAYLLADEAHIPGALVVSAVGGLAGIGKTTLAASLAHDLEVQARFPDGVLWASLGQQPNILQLLTVWIQALGDHDFQPSIIEAASAHLRTLLHDRACLLMVDDVRQADHVRPFMVGSSRCQILITTRDVNAIAQQVGARIYRLDVMTQEQSLDLLSVRLERTLEGMEREDALELAEAVGYLPLALELAAAQVARGTPWVDLQQAVETEKEQSQISERVEQDSIAELDLFAQLIEQGENSQVELKSTMRYNLHTHRRDRELDMVMAKTICGFMNTEGGTLIIGIDDGGNALGLENDLSILERKDEDGFVWAFADIVRTHLGPEYRQNVNCRFVNYRDKKICVIQVERSPNPVFCLFDQGNEFYVRVGNTTKRLDAKQAMEYIKGHFQESGASSNKTQA